MRKSKINPETLILRSVRQYLRLKGWDVVRIQQGPFSEAGIPDLFIMREGKDAWIEIKTPNGKLSEPQRDFEMRCFNAGMPFYVIRSLDEAMDVFP